MKGRWGDTNCFTWTESGIQEGIKLNRKPENPEGGLGILLGAPQQMRNGGVSEAFVRWIPLSQEPARYPRIIDERIYRGAITPKGEQENPPDCVIEDATVGGPDQMFLRILARNVVPARPCSSFPENPDFFFFSGRRYAAGSEEIQLCDYLVVFVKGHVRQILGKGPAAYSACTSINGSISDTVHCERRDDGYCPKFPTCGNRRNYVDIIGLASIEGAL